MKRSLQVLKNNAKKVSEKTLLIPKEYISPKFTLEDIKSAPKEEKINAFIKASIKLSKKHGILRLIDEIKKVLS